MKDVFESVRFQQESPSAIKSGGCPLSSRIRVRFKQELLSALARNWCPLCSGICIWAYGDIYGHYFKNMRGRFPEASAVMELIKSIHLNINPTKDNYKNLSCLVYQEESRVFRRIWRKLDEGIGWFLTCHDEITVPKTKTPHAHRIMNDILSEELGNIPFEIRPE